MATNETLTIIDKDESALRILSELPEGKYTEHYQPDYSHDENGLLSAISELCTTEPVTKPRQVDAVLSQLSEISKKESDEFIVIEGGCEEPVSLSIEINALVKRATVSAETIASSALQQVLHIRRDRGQNSKPRSKPKPTPYMGDAVNCEDIDRRQPEPSRMVGAADQARDLEHALTAKMDQRIPASHEALLLAYEKSFIRIDPDTNTKYLLSTDIPWVGLRTNSPEGEHVSMLEEIENPVGIKLGAETTEEKILDIANKLNPENIPGKLIFMLRLGLNNINSLPGILENIQEHAPNSLVMYDIHGSTKSLPDGRKTRVVSEIIDEINIMISMCKDAGTRLHGIHLETMDDDMRLECVDEPWQLPTHQGRVDPQINPRQLKRILDETAHNLELIK